MTAIGVTAVRRAPRLRLTIRGRRVLAALIAAPVVAALSVAVVGGGAALAVRDAAPASTAYRMVTVVPGDSLWSIAQRVDPRDDPRDVVDTIVDLNALGDVSIVPGQRLAVPTAGHADR